MRPLVLAALLAAALGCCTFALQRPQLEPPPPSLPPPQATAPVPPEPRAAVPAAPTSASATTEKALDLAKWHLDYAHGVLRGHALEDDTHHD